MPEKDPLSYSLLTYYWVIGLSTLGAIVSFHQKVKKGTTRAWNITEFVGEVCTSGLTGLLTFFLCENYNVSPMLEAFFIGVAGHMGTSLIYLFEKGLEKVFSRYMKNFDDETKDSSDRVSIKEDQEK